MANAQVVVGLQGGYYSQNHVNSINANYAKATSWIGGVEVGYMITPKLYVGIVANYAGDATDSTLEKDNMYITVGSHEGMRMDVDNHTFLTKQSGWMVSPTVKYEIVKYGNMHFNVMLQGTVRSTGYTLTDERYYKPWENNGEWEDLDPVSDSVGHFSWGVSVRPTLSYDFSTHLSAELSLDFLSVGFVSETMKYDQELIRNDNGTVTPREPYTTTSQTLYAGLNTLMETLRWENPMLRLGFKYTF